MRPFTELTVRGQAKRMRGVAFDALRRYDLDIDRLEHVATETNTTFRVRTADGLSFALRIGTSGPIAHSVTETESEIAWLRALAADGSVPVPAPLANQDGRFLTVGRADDVPEARTCVMMDWLPGPLLADRIDGASLGSLGALMAALHEHGAGFARHDRLPISVFDSPFPFDEPTVLFDDAHARWLPAGRRAIFEETLVRVSAALGRLLASGEPVRILHGDLHQWNVKYYRGHLLPFDFEDLLYGWPVQDIATTLYYLQDRGDFSLLRDAYRRGYETVAPWPERTPREIDTFMAGRALLLANDVVQMEEPGLAAMLPGYFERWEHRLRRFLTDG